MAQEKFAVRLSEEDRSQLERSIRSGQRSARIINRARILLKTDAGWSASQVTAALDTSPRTVFRTKRRYAEEELDGVLYDHPQANRYRKLDDRGEAHPVLDTGWALIALACSDDPEDQDHWTLRLLADKVVELGLVESLSYETVRLRLKKHPQTLAKTAVVHLPDERGVRGRPASSTGQAMEDVLDLYAEPYDPSRPVVCFDETSTQLLADVREPLPVQQGRPRRQDYEYRRGGTRNLFLFCEPLAGWRVRLLTNHAITQRRIWWTWPIPHATVIRAVLDNLNTHRMASLYETFPAAEARRIVKRLEFHHTPKQASRLKMAEIQFSALSRACLKGRNPDADSLHRAITAYENRRHAAPHPHQLALRHP